MTIGETAGNFTGYIPNAAAASQEDILVAKHTSATKEAKVPLNFRHALSQIVVKAKNTNPSLKVTITGVRIGYIKTASTSFTYSGDATDTRELGTANNAANVAQSDWKLVDFAETPTTTTANDYKYDQDVTTLALIGNTADTDHDLTGTTSWLLLPQNMTDADGKYATQKTGTKGTANPDLAGAYLALKMTIENYNGASATGTIVSEQWCYWYITTRNGILVISILILLTLLVAAMSQKIQTMISFLIQFLMVQLLYLVLLVQLTHGILKQLMYLVVFKQNQITKVLPL